MPARGRVTQRRWIDAFAEAAKNKPACNRGLEKLEPGDSLAAVLAHGQMLALEGELVVHRGTWRSSEVGHGGQVLEVIGKPAKRIGEATEISGVFQGVSILKRAAGRAVSVVDYQRIIHPFGDLVR